jgi:hypothetical protein
VLQLARCRRRRRRRRAATITTTIFIITAITNTTCYHSLPRQIVLSLYFLRGFGPEPTNATELPLGNQSYVGAAISRSGGSFVSVVVTGA